MKQTIRCEKCESEWTVEEKISYSITKCPFCGEVISNKKDTYESVSESIQDIISKYGKEIFLDSKRFYALLTDYIPEKEKELKALKIACNENIFCSFANIDKSQVEFESKKAKRRLEEDCFMSESNASQVVSWVVIALGYQKNVSNVSVKSQDNQSGDFEIQNGNTYKNSRRVETSYTKSSTGLEFTLNEDGKSYTLVGIGTCNEVNITVDEYNGLPVTSIGFGAFEDCSNLTSITISNSVTSIGDYAFSQCSNLTNITMPNSVTSIGYCTFYGCTKLTSISIPNSVKGIGYRAFSQCSNLTSITIPNSVVVIYGRAFEDCSNLTSITLSNRVRMIGGDVFWGCSSLKKIYGFDYMKPPWVFPLVIINKLYYYSEEKPKKKLLKRYWHYVNGVPTPWEK